VQRQWRLFSGFSDNEEVAEGGEEGSDGFRGSSSAANCEKGAILAAGGEECDHAVVGGKEGFTSSATCKEVGKRRGGVPFCLAFFRISMRTVPAG
jgi:hypothetical protein